MKVVSLCSEQVVDEFVVPNEENLRNLGRGCFVRVAVGSNNVWLELTEVDGRKITGVVHEELNEACPGLTVNSVIESDAGSINALGCDRYCYCD